MQMSNLLSSATNTVDSQEQSLKQQVVAAILSGGGGESRGGVSRKRTASEAAVDDHDDYLDSKSSESSLIQQTRLEEEEEEEEAESRVVRQSADTLTTTPPHSPHYSSYYCGGDDNDDDESDNDFMTISSSSFVDHQPPKKPRKQQQQNNKHQQRPTTVAQQLLKVDIGQKGGEKVIVVDCGGVNTATNKSSTHRLSDSMTMTQIDSQQHQDSSVSSTMQTPPQSAIIITPNSIANTCMTMSAVDSPQSDSSSTHHHQHMNQQANKSELDFLEEALSRIETEWDENRSRHVSMRQQIKHSFGRLRQTQANYFEIYLREQIDQSKRQENEMNDSMLVDLNYEIQKSKDADQDGLMVHASRCLDDLTDDEDDEKALFHNQVAVEGATLTDTSNKSELFWGVQRVQLGSEWQRIQAKMSLLRQQNNELTENKENKSQEETTTTQIANMRIQALTESLKESVMSSSRVEARPLQPAKQIAGFESNSLNQTHISKCIMNTAAYFNQNVLKTSCLCDEPDDDHPVRPSPHPETRRRSARVSNRTCICCHSFKTTDNISNNNKTSRKIRRDALADHTYCKELKFVRRLEAGPSSSSVPSKMDHDLSLSPKSDDSESSKSVESFQDQMTVSMTNRDFVVAEEESLIDAGVELSLQDIKLIPDLTYDEIKFLCDEDYTDQEDHFVSNINRPRLGSSLSVTSARVPTTGDSLWSQSTHQLNAPLVYSPPSVTVTTTVNTELRKKRQTARRTSNPTGVVVAPALPDTRSRSSSSRKVKVQLKNVLFNKRAVITTPLVKEKRKLSGVASSDLSSSKKARLSDMSPVGGGGKARKSARSNSNLSTESTPGVTRSPSSSSSSASSFHFNKFDIDNILLPPEMIISNYKLDPKFVEHRVVVTPRWRVRDDVVNSFPEFDQEIEDLDDETFWKRHETAELKERYFMVYKRMERHQSNSSSSSSSSIKLNREVFEREHQLDTLTLFELRSRVLQLESNEKNQRRRQLSNTSSTSLSNSMSTTDMKIAASAAGTTSTTSQLARTTSSSILSASLPQSSLKSILSNKQPVVIPSSSSAKPHAHMSINSTNITRSIGPTGLVINHQQSQSQQQQRWTARKFPLTDVEMNELNSSSSSTSINRHQ